MIWTDALPYFPRHELDCKGSRDGGPGTGVIQLDIRMATALPYLREQWGRALSPTSVCRTPSHNESVGGHPRSLHLTDNPAHPTARGTLAADLGWRGWPTADQLDLARLAWELGWAVGLHDGFVHVDRRREIGLQQTVFLYGTWTGAFGPEEVRKKR